MRIGSLELADGAWLAPLAGYSDIAFRAICREAGAALTVSEMVSCKGLMFGNNNTENLLRLSEREIPSCVQLFGNDPEIFREVIPRIKADIIDINMGCPVPKVVKNGEGSALMNNVPLAEKIVRAAADSADGRPVTVKFRSGFESVNAVEFAKAMEGAGASAVTVHGRLRVQYYSGTADWNLIESVKRAVGIPVIGNGDVRSIGDYEAAMNRGVDAVAIGRGALGNPYLFAKIAKKPFCYTRRELIERHIAELKKYFNENYVTNTMKKHILAYLVGERGTKEAKRRICLCVNLQEMLDVVRDFFEKP